MGEGWNGAVDAGADDPDGFYPIKLGRQQIALLFRKGSGLSKSEGLKNLAQILFFGFPIVIGRFFLPFRNGPNSTKIALQNNGEDSWQFMQSLSNLTEGRHSGAHRESRCQLASPPITPDWIVLLLTLVVRLSNAIRIIGSGR